MGRVRAGGAGRRAGRRRRPLCPNPAGHDGQGRCRAASAPRDRKSTRGALTVLSPGVNARRPFPLYLFTRSLTFSALHSIPAGNRRQGSESEGERVNKDEALAHPLRFSVLRPTLLFQSGSENQDE